MSQRGSSVRIPQIRHDEISAFVEIARRSLSVQELDALAENLLPSSSIRPTLGKKRKTEELRYSQASQANSNINSTVGDTVPPEQEEEEEDTMIMSPAGGAPQFLNHDVMVEVLSYVGFLGKASCSFALVNRRWYLALASPWEQWRNYQQEFGLPPIHLISNKSSTKEEEEASEGQIINNVNYRRLAVRSLRTMVLGDRSRILFPESHITAATSNPLPNNMAADGFWLVRTGHFLGVVGDRNQEEKIYNATMMFLESQRNLRCFLALPAKKIDWPRFLAHKELLHVDFKGLGFSGASPPTTRLGTEVLSGCASLTSVDLSGLQSVTEIEGSLFLAACRSLTDIDLSPLKSVRSIPSEFLFHCKSLTKLDFTGMISVTHISSNFLGGCSSLTKLDMSGLRSVTTIGVSFLDQCSSLEELDLSSLTSAHLLQYNSLKDCSALKRLSLPPNLRNIQEPFLPGCSSLDQEAKITGYESLSTAGRLIREHLKRQEARKRRKKGRKK